MAEAEMAHPQSEALYDLLRRNVNSLWFGLDLGERAKTSSEDSLQMRCVSTVLLCTKSPTSLFF